MKHVFKSNRKGRFLSLIANLSSILKNVLNKIIELNFSFGLRLNIVPVKTEFKGLKTEIT